MSKRKFNKPRDYLKDIKHGVCPNCGDKGPHFVPPSLGDPGFFMCPKKNCETRLEEF